MGDDMEQVMREHKQLMAESDRNLAESKAEDLPQDQEEPEGIEERDLNPKEQAYISGLMKMLHSPQTSGQVVSILKSAPPERSIPEATLLVNEQMEKAIQQKGQKVPLETKLVGGAYLVQDLIEIGNAAQAYEQEIPEDAVPMLLEVAMEGYIKKGLDDGTIDPVELQQKIEPLMRKGQRENGLLMGEMTDVPPEPNQRTAMEKYATDRERAATDKIATKQAAQNRQGMMQGGQ